MGTDRVYQLSLLADLMQDELFPNWIETPSRYSYFPIPAFAQIIRVLHLLPGEGSAQLRGSLSFAAVKSGTSYSALSYTWGAPERPCTLLLGSQHLPITVSLHEALLQLRSPTEIRRLWVDAVCINQEDLDERADQVRLMKFIYQQADRVMCWLGADNESSEGAKVVDLLEKLGQVSFRSLSAGVPPAEFMQSHHLPGAGDCIWTSVVKFFNRPWFRRVWIVQEFVLGKEVHMLCGFRVLDWRDINNGVFKVSRYSLLRWGMEPLVYTNTAPSIVQRRLREETAVARSAVSDFVTLANLRIKSSQKDWFDDIFHKLSVGDTTPEDLEAEFKISRNPMITLILRNYKLFEGFPDKRGIERSIHNIVRSGRARNLEFLHLRSPIFPFVSLAFDLTSRLATDPRDKLFGLLGLVAEGDDPALKPSYRESVTSVYIRFARHFITKATTRETMYVLLEAGLHSQPTVVDSSLPSWVYDWSHRLYADLNPLPSLGAKSTLYRAAGDTLPKCLSTASPRELAMTGLRIDTIGTTITRAKIDGHLDQEDLPSTSAGEDGQFLNAAESALNFTTDLKRFFIEADSLFLNLEFPVRQTRPDETRQEVMWRTLIANITVSQAGLPVIPDQRHGLGSLEYRRWATDPDVNLTSDLSTAASQWGHQFLCLTMCHVICTTATGWAGLVPRCTVAGDEIHVLLGVDMPVVLRPVGETGHRYQLVGPCYVHGIMQGEGLRDQSSRLEEVRLV